MLNKIRLNFKLRKSRECYVVDLEDQCVMYIGTYKQCKKAINVLPGGLYCIFTYADLNEEEKSSLELIT